MSVDIQSVTLKDLLAAGLISSKEKIYGQYDDCRIEANIRSSGEIVFKDIVSTSLSVSAGKAVTAICGKTSPKRKYLSINGWLFWHVTRSGDTKSLADLRQEYVET
jgi:hypothetical protein